MSVQLISEKFLLMLRKGLEFHKECLGETAACSQLVQ